MISPEDFYKQVFQNFKDLGDNFEKKIDKIEEKIDDLCNRTAENTKKIDEHLAVMNALEVKEGKKVDNRDKKFYVIIALVGVVFSVITLIKG